MKLTELDDGWKTFSDGLQCVEFKNGDDGTVVIRDSEDRSKTITTTQASLNTFVQGLAGTGD